MPATLTREPKPARRGKHAREVRVAPRPVACPHCDGSAVEPDEENGVIPCFRCDGLGVVPAARFDLLHTRTYELRRVSYTPTCRNTGVLKIGVAVKETREIAWCEYEVAEFANDWRGRSFALRKRDCDDPEDEARTVFIGPSEKSCPCKGMTFLSTARANQFAWDEGRKVYFSLGCKHLDACDALLAGGWFDLADPTE